MPALLSSMPLTPMPTSRTGRCPAGSRWHRSSSATRTSSWVMSVGADRVWEQVIREKSANRTFKWTVRPRSPFCRNRQPTCSVRSPSQAGSSSMSATPCSNVISYEIDLAFLNEVARSAEEKGGQSPFVLSTLRAVPANGDCPPFSRRPPGITKCYLAYVQEQLVPTLRPSTFNLPIPPGILSPVGRSQISYRISYP